MTFFACFPVRPGVMHIAKQATARFNPSPCARLSTVKQCLDNQCMHDKPSILRFGLLVLRNASLIPTQHQNVISCR